MSDEKVVYVEREICLTSELAPGCALERVYKVATWGWPDTCFREPRIVRVLYEGKGYDSAKRALDNHKKKYPKLKDTSPKA